MVALGVTLHRLEALLPFSSPWVKLGLTNLMTLVALVFLRFKEVVIVTFLRVAIGSILGETFLGPIFFLSLVGGIAAIIHMSLICISIF
jgi:heptaprenyl diphosphate synthase